MTKEAGMNAIRHLLQEGGKPAFTCIQVWLAFGVFRAASALTVVMGRDLPVLGGRSLPCSEYSVPPLSTFSPKDSKVAE